MDYSMMPPPPSTTCPVSMVTAGAASGDFSGAGGGAPHYSSNESPTQSQLFNNEQQQPTQSNNQFTSTQQQYKPHFSGRAHVNRPPPLSLHQTYYRDNVTPSMAHTPHYHTDQVAHCISASPHHAQSPLVAHSPHIEQSPRPVPHSPHLTQSAHMLHRQSSGTHIVQSPHLAQSPHLNSYPGGGEMSPRPTPAHMQQSIYADRNQSPLAHSGSTAYDSISSPVHAHKPRHYSEPSASPHPYNVHPVANPSVHLYNNAPNPSPHPYVNDPNPSPHHFNDPVPSPHHFNDPNPSPYNDPGPHRSVYLDTSQPGTPATAYSHPGTPAGYLDSPHPHSSPHPARSAYQHFFGPNVPLPLPVNGSNHASSTDATSLDMSNNGGQFNQPSADGSQQQQQRSSANAALLHSNPGGQGDAMLSAINLRPQEPDTTSIQDSQQSHTDSNAMETDWPSATGPQKMKSSSSTSSGFTLFEGSGNPPGVGVDELLSQATDFIANPSTMSLSDAPKEPAKVKPRAKGRPSKNALSPRSYGAQCPICGKTFNNSSALAKHKLTHSDERKYVCQLCSKAFKRQDHLNGHMMTHRTKKPFECSFEGCTKSYCDARSLRRHLENHHNVPSETLYDMSLTNYTALNGNVYHQGFHGGSGGGQSTPSPHASPSYLNGPGGQQFFRFDQSHPSADGSQQPTYMYSEGLQPAECTICHKRFKNLPALNGHMRLHGGYVNVKKSESTDNKSTKSDGSVEGTSKKLHTPRTLQQHMHLGGGKVYSPSSSRDSSSITAHNLMLLNNKTYSMEQTALAISSPASTDDPISQSNINQNNNQGNVRQGGDGVPGLAPSYLGAGLHFNPLSSSEPIPPFPINTSTLPNQFHFSSMDHQTQVLSEQLMIMAHQQQMQRQMQGAAGISSVGGVNPSTLSFPTLSVPPAEHLLLDMRARADSFPSSMFLNSPASKVSDLSQERVVTPGKDSDMHTASISSFLTVPHQPVNLLRKTPSPRHQDQEDHEVSQITSTESHVSIALTMLNQPTEGDTERFLAQRKRHASAPDHITDSKSWYKQDTDASNQQQHLNEEYAKAVGQAMIPPPSNRRRRSSADNHHQHNFKHPYTSSGDLLTRSDGAVLFRSPPHGGVKKRRHRPEPLVIPPNLAAVQSRLRSPRLPEHSEGNGLRHTGKTPPPYTPPPILSPLRSGTGLFYGMYSRAHTVSAPSGVGLSSSLPSSRLLSQLKQQESIPEEPPSEPPQVSTAASVESQSRKPEGAEQLQEQLIGAVAEDPTIKEEVVTPDTSDVPPPLVTDIDPHINVGPGHQATLPTLRTNRREAERDTDRGTLLWTPECLDHSITVQELSAYMELSRSAAVPGNGSNKEYALHQLYFNKGDIARATLSLMSRKVSSQFLSFIQDYHYQNSDVWTTEEIELFRDLVVDKNKNFVAVCSEFQGKKTHKQCVEFYYFWKKVCHDEYKRLRMKRHCLRPRDTEKGEAANTAAASDGDDSNSLVSDSGEADDEDIASDIPSPRSTPISHHGAMNMHIPPPPPQQIVYRCEYPGCSATYNSKAGLNGHAKIHVLPHMLNPSAASVGGMNHHGVRSQLGPSAPKKVKTEPVPPAPGSEEFPCKLCGKVFYKVKSRSAHMKSHSVLAKKAREAAQQAKLNS